jgi:hypothetical protein
MLMTMGCGGTTGDEPFSSDAQGSLCEAHRSALENSACGGEPPAPELLNLVYDECVQQLRDVVEECRPAVERFYECLRVLHANCDLDACDAESREYARCVSGGTCEDLGGGSALPASANPDRASIFHDHEACACIDSWNGQAPGTACQTWEDCAPICCACPGSTFQYTGAACDFSQSADLSHGTCAAPERVCALTSDRCP